MWGKTTSARGRGTSATRVRIRGKTRRTGASPGAVAPSIDQREPEKASPPDHPPSDELRSTHVDLLHWHHRC